MNPYDKYSLRERFQDIDISENKFEWDQYNNYVESGDLPKGWAPKPWEPLLDLDLLSECLEYSIDSSDPLPRKILELIKTEVDLLRSGRESVLLKKRPGTKPSTHPTAKALELAAVSYLLTCEKNPDSDHDSVATICWSYDVSDSTVSRWKKTYKDTAISDLCASDIKQIRNGMHTMYQWFKPKSTPGW